MAQQIKYAVEGFTFGGVHSSVIVLDHEDPDTELAYSVLRETSLDMEVTIGGTTMFWAAWEDPDHWAENWAEKLGCTYEEAPARVREILDDAIVEYRPNERST